MFSVVGFFFLENRNEVGKIIPCPINSQNCAIFFQLVCRSEITEIWDSARLEESGMELQYYVIEIVVLYIP